MKSYTVRRNLFGTLTANTSTTNLALGDQLMNDSDRYLTTKFFLNERSYIVPGGTIASQQNYKLPYNIKQIVNCFINVGNIRYQLTEAPTRQFWDSLNFVPYTSDIPQYYYIFNKQLYVFPTPASNSNPITIIYKMRLTELSQPDYTTGTVSVTKDSTTVTGGGTAWTSAMAGRWLQIAAPTGDNNWYEIESVTNGTTLVLVNAYAGTTASGATYTIGEMPILPEDYHDLPIYRALSIYFTTRVPDPTRAEEFKTLYNEGYAKLDAEFGSKSSSVAITPADSDVVNPNLFTRSIG